MRRFLIKVADGESGRRLDLFLSDYFKREMPGLSRNMVQKLIADGNVSLGGSPAESAHYKVKGKDVIRVAFEEKKPSGLEAEKIPLDIIYEDKDLAVINKPAGLVVHPAPGNTEHTLVNALLHHFKQLSDINPQRPGIVHRLDKETSGLLVIAKNNFSHQELAKQFSEHSIKRKYAAIVKGSVEFDEGQIEVPIGRHPFKRKNMAAGFGKNTKYARTHYRTLKRSSDYSLLELEPFTGRTHQLRVHLVFLGHQILGDNKYGKEKGSFKRLALHAFYLGFIHPRTNKFVEFSIPLPKEFKEFVK